MDKKPSSDKNKIIFGNNKTPNSEGTVTSGTSGQSSSSTGQSITFNHSSSQSSSNNNLTSTNPVRPETGGFHPYPGGTSTGSSPATNTQGQSVQGADGQSASAVGQSASAVQSSSTTVTNGQTAVVNQPGQTVTGASSTVIGSDGQDVNTGTTSTPYQGFTKPLTETTHPDGSITESAPGQSDIVRPPAGAPNNDTPTYTTPANADPDTMYASGGNTPVAATKPYIETDSDSSTINQPGSVSSSQGQSVSSGSLHMTRNPDGPKTISNGSMNMTKGADDSKHLSIGSMQMSSPGDGSNSGNNPAARSADDPSSTTPHTTGAPATSGDSGFPPHSTYNFSVSADTIKSQIQSSMPKMNGWGSSDHVPPDPASGVLGVDKNKLTNPFDTKDSDKKV